MTEYSDKEQIDMIKRWWREYGKSITFAIILGLAVGFGWRYWHRHKIETAERASIIYTQMQITSSQGKYDAAHNYAKRLMKDYRRTPYAGMSALLSARNSVAQKKYKEALKELQWAVKNAKMKSARQIARLRVARMLIMQKQYANAMTEIKTVDDSTYQPLIDTVKGDIYSAQGKKALAKQSYQAAKAGLDGNRITDTFLNMKLST